TRRRDGASAGSLPPVPDAAGGRTQARARGAAVVPLSPARLVVTEHRAPHVRCSEYGQVSVGRMPLAAPSRAPYARQVGPGAVCLVEQQLVPLGRVQRLLADLFGRRLARSTLVSWIQQAARVVQRVEAAIKAALRQAPVLHSDETDVRRA